MDKDQGKVIGFVLPQLVDPPNRECTDQRDFLNEPVAWPTGAEPL